LESWDWNTGIITLTKQKQVQSDVHLPLPLTCTPSPSHVTFSHQPTSMRVYHGRGRPSAAVREAMAVAAEREQQKVRHSEQLLVMKETF